MTAELTPEPTSLIRQLNENINALLFRMNWRHKDMAAAIGISDASVSRKLKNLNDWSVPEMERLASAAWVTVPELLSDLPNFDTWNARRENSKTPTANDGGLSEARPKGFEPLTF